MVLLSDPVQLLLTADALLGKARNVRVWLNREDDPLASISTRDAPEVLRSVAPTAASGAHGGPDAVIEVTKLGRGTDDIEATPPLVARLEFR
jgi:hypothetical protein